MQGGGSHIERFKVLVFLDFLEIFLEKREREGSRPP